MPTYIKDTENGRLFLRGNLGDHCSCGWVCDALCDYPVGNGKTCDRKLCDDNCAFEVAPDTHYCKDHKAEWDKFFADGGVKTVLENVTPFKPFAKRRGLI